jgi:hypothetical protein
LPCAFRERIVAFFNAGPLMVLIPYVVWRRAIQIKHLRAVAIIEIFTGPGLSFYASGRVFSSVIRVTLLFYLTPILWRCCPACCYLKNP